jgi:subtilisin family serine protease
MRVLVAVLSSIIAAVVAPARPSASAAVSWALDRIDQAALPLDGSYRPQASGRGVTIYVIDTGTAIDHVEFGGRAAYLGDFRVVGSEGSTDLSPGRDAGPCPSDGLQGHGTHTASLAAGSTFGVAPQARLEIAKTNCGNAEAAQIAAAIHAFRYIAVRATRPAVVNFSFRYQNAALNAAIHEVIAAGFPVTLSAGCAGEVDQYWGAGTDITGEALIVAGTDVRDRASLRGAYGPNLALFAPGVAVTSAAAFDADGRPSTTATYTSPDECSDSYAAPIVAGAAALFLERSPHASPAEIRAAILARATRGVVGRPGTSTNLLLRVP